MLPQRRIQEPKFRIISSIEYIISMYVLPQDSVNNLDQISIYLYKKIKKLGHSFKTPEVQMKCVKKYNRNFRDHFFMLLEKYKLLLRNKNRTALVSLWIRIRLPNKGTWVRSLIWEDFTCHRTTKPLCYNDSVGILEPGNY